MGSGYVLDFSNRTLQEFVADSVKRDIYCGTYDYGSNSKANLLRRFWEIEPNNVVGKLLDDLLRFVRTSKVHEEQELIEECQKIAARLRDGTSVESIETIGEDIDDKDIELLIGSIRGALDANEPETSLDRLHTLTTKFLRHICRKRGIEASKDKPLHSLLGEYIRMMNAAGLIESEMTDRILKSSISILEAFNRVRNEQSFAHDNPILNYDESLLICSNVVSVIAFLQALEAKHG